jgi:hypothetical protein
MNRLSTITAATVLMTASATVAHAAPNAGGQVSEKEAKTVESTLIRMDRQAAAISDNAFVMNRAIARTDDYEYQDYHLIDLKNQVNRVGQELAAIEAERASLPQWQRDAVDQITPLMHDVAAEANEAIRTYNVDQGRLFASDYGVDTKEISANAQKVSQRLHDDIKLADTKAVEARVAATVDRQSTAPSSNQASVGSGM